MLYALAGIVIGFAAGWYFPLYLPFEYARLLSVSLMAALDNFLMQQEKYRYMLNITLISM